MSEHAKSVDLKMVFQWANESGAHGMARPAYLESKGWVKVRQHPLWPKSWLMRKEAE